MSIEEMLEECRRQFLEHDYDRTIEICDEILKMDLNNQRALGYKARSLYLLDECGEALKLLDNALRIYPDNPYYFSIKAEVLMEMEEYDKSIECYEKAFEIGISDESDLAFIRMDYEICLSLRMAQLIENESYVDAWECFNKRLNFFSVELERPKAIKEFRRYVKEHATKGKRRQYHVRISSNDSKLKLADFLKENGFESYDDSGLMLLIDVVDKTYDAVSVDDIGDNEIISESKFYDKVNYYPRNKIIKRKLFDDDGNLLYEGYTLHNAPYGFGTAYFSNGKVYREGIFDIKGIVQGNEFYPSGQLRFKGQWSLTRGYGPNAPYDGEAYDEDGELIYSGKFEIKRGGVGWPMIQKPKGFPLEQKERPKIDYY